MSESTYGRCDACGCRLEYHSIKRGDLYVCKVCSKHYDLKGMHKPSPPPRHKDGAMKP